MRKGGDEKEGRRVEEEENDESGAGARIKLFINLSLFISMITLSPFHFHPLYLYIK